MTAEAIQMTPAHFGNLLDLQTAIPRSTLPTKESATTSSLIAENKPSI
ncbi:MAG: hypothetical protein M3299_07825 [Thermoproteota archaeon]|nr:hypothetical protein [Thermoproteota archaeon]